LTHGEIKAEVEFVKYALLEDNLVEVGKEVFNVGEISKADFDSDRLGDIEHLGMDNVLSGEEGPRVVLVQPSELLH
jgi:hypothetical protein